MTTHVFVVDVQTFKYHLEYLFAGTGAKDHKVNFNNTGNGDRSHTIERNQVGMIADGGRIRRGDYIIFYLQQDQRKQIEEDKFFGVFKAKHDNCFLDNHNEHQYLKKELGKSLTFRTLIEPHRVYPEGITEWEGLDEIKKIGPPYQMLWSLIYRKLKGNRGNTMITIYESECLIQMIRDKNSRAELSCQGKRLTFDESHGGKIVCQSQAPRSYKGVQEKINILPRFIGKYDAGHKLETHLQAYIAQNLGRNTNDSLDTALLNNKKLEWLGNEVSCGVGMQRIDLMCSVNDGNDSNERTLMIIELKSAEAVPDNVWQMQRYIDWTEQYYIPNHPSDVRPVLLSKKISDKNSDAYQDLLSSIKEFNEQNKNIVPLCFVEFSVVNDQLLFEKVCL